MSETRVRGSFLNSVTVFTGLGIALAYLCCSALGWRLGCLVAIAANILSALALACCTQSPVFLLMRKQGSCGFTIGFHNIREGPY